MREVKAPSRSALDMRVFLAGSIEMGQAEQWQERVVHALSDAGDLVILNPRRDDWGSWRWGNVEIVCARHRIPLFDTLDDLLADPRSIVRVHLI